MRTNEEVNRTVSDSERLGRELTKRLCEQQGWAFTEGDVNEPHYDCFIEMDGHQYIGEIKVRDVKFIRKPTLHFELKKYKNLNEASDRIGVDRIFYINWLGNQCFVFDVNDKLIAESEFGYSFSNRVTARSRAVEDKTYKPMYFLPKYMANRYFLRNYDRIKEEIIREFDLHL